MTNAVKVKALCLALQTAKREYDTTEFAKPILVAVIAYLTAKVKANAKPKPTYCQLSMSGVAGRPNGKYHCQRCGQHFGENRVSRLQSRRAYLSLHCPHCGYCWYTDNSQ